MNNFIKLLKEPLPSVKAQLYDEYDKKYDDRFSDLYGFLTLFDDSLFTEKSLDSINFKGKVKAVYVHNRPKEGWEKPHIHLENEDFHCAIRLDKPEYFIHGIYVDTLNNKQAKLFDEFMRVKDAYNISRWQAAVSSFNLHFETHQIKGIKQPDYTKLNDGLK